MTTVPAGRRRDVTSAAPTVAAVLVAFGAAYGLHRGVDMPVTDVVLGVVLTLTLSRTFARANHHPLLLVLEVPVVALAAAGAGRLVVEHPWIGQPLLVVALSIGVLARRWGGLVRQAGRLVALPFLALLVTPVPTAAGAARGSVTQAALWAPAVGLIAVGCAAAAAALRRRFLAVPPQPPDARAQRSTRSGRRLDAPTRMAAQMASGLGAALVIGHLLFGDRWAWTLLSAFIVASGNRGRGDVVHKAALRTAGAGIGTVAVSLATVDLPPGNRWLIVALLGVLAVALVLRERNYAFWAAGVTAMVALLHGYYGDTGTTALWERILGVLVGSAIGVAAAWFVLPVRTIDVVRRRLADCLAALTDDLDPERTGPGALPAALGGLAEVTPALRAHARVIRRWGAPSAVPAVDAMYRLAQLPDDERARRRLRRDTVRVRRAIVGRDDPAPDELVADLVPVHAYLQASARVHRPALPGQPAAAVQPQRSPGELGEGEHGHGVGERVRPGAATGGASGDHARDDAGGVAEQAGARAAQRGQRRQHVHDHEAAGDGDRAGG